MPVSETANAVRAMIGLLGSRNHDANRTSLGELDSVAHEVDENLPQADGVGADRLGKRRR